jgi:hypothetical protein
MISRFFKKKKKPAAPPARKAVSIEKPKIKAKTVHQKTLTAEGWRRMMMRNRKSKKT